MKRPHTTQSHQAKSRKNMLSVTKRGWLLVFMICLWLGQARGAAAAGFAVYVSPRGDDQAAGTEAQPFRTLFRAVAAMREWRSGGGAGPATVWLRQGRHQLDQTLVLGMEDGAPAPAEPIVLPQHGAGETSAPAWLTFAAYPGEHPVISAGVPVTGWKRLDPAPPALPEKARGKVWVADIPGGLGRFYTLYNGVKGGAKV